MKSHITNKTDYCDGIKIFISLYIMCTVQHEVVNATEMNNKVHM